METEKYGHRKVDGLPASLVKTEGSTFAVLALMQRKAGLNRDLRRELANEVKLFSFEPDAQSRKLPKSEINLVSQYMSASIRFACFWRAARRLKEGKGGSLPKTFARALDLPLIQEYEPSWMGLQFDADRLTAACPEWPVLRERMEAELEEGIERFPLEALMIWPLVLEDLARWDNLTDGRRKAVGWAVFAMSSITLSDWFIVQALERCPALSEELGGLLDRGYPEEAAGPATVPASESCVTEDRTEWQSRLDSLIAGVEGACLELRQHPTRSALVGLKGACEQIEALERELPDDESLSRAEHNGNIEALLAEGRELGGEDAFAWLDEPLLNQVAARWHLALRESSDGEDLGPLTEDAHDAVRRGAECADRYRCALAERDTIAAQVRSVEADVNSARSLAERRVTERRKTTLQLEMVNAEAALPTLQDELLAAWSPRAAPFEHGIDYRAALDREGDGMQPAIATPAESREPSAENVLSPAATLPTNAIRNDAIPGSAPANGDHVPPESPIQLRDEAANGTPSVPAPEVAQGAVPEPRPRDDTSSVQRAGEASHTAPAPARAQPSGDAAPTPDIFSAIAGEACRPIWALLKLGECSLAYQLASAMEAGPNAPLVPHTALLASVALAKDLMLPDGSVKEALAQHFATFEPTWFAEQGPRDWHSAVNLLLVACTLRPLVLAPGSGASSIAGYLHLDVNYTAVYELVQRLRYFSDRLEGFRIDPTTLKLVRSDAAMQEEQRALEAEAQDWLYVQAPAVTIKFSAATRVWQQWLKPQGVISRLVAPIVSNRRADVHSVKELVATLTDAGEFHKLVRDTDRRENKRRTGDDIHAGALERLRRCTVEAVSLARHWISVVEAESQTGDRMRTLLREVRSELAQRREACQGELQRTDTNDAWHLVSAAQAVVQAELGALWNLFDATAKLPPEELAAHEVLGQGLLLVPSIRVGDDWSIVGETADAAAAIAAMAGQLPIDRRLAFESRLRQGDLHGAQWLADACEDPALSDHWKAEMRRELDSWRTALRRSIDEVRRDVEVGLAYGYLSEAERGSCESRLVQWEAGSEEIRRFDRAVADVDAVRQTVQRNRDDKTAAVRRVLSNIGRSPENEGGIVDIERILEQGDIATANELLQRVAAGLPAWPTEERAVDHFEEFFPTATQALEGWLSSRPREAIEGAIRQGQSVPGLDFSDVAGAQREQAGKMHAAWSDLKSRRQGEAGRLAALISGLGFAVQQLSVSERVGGREYWTLNTERIEDRSVCPIPQFGSSARGRYRLICLWERPAEDDIVQLVGESTLERATIVLYFGRMTERKWRDTSRLARAHRRAFLLVDEVMLTYLCAERGSRLAAMFDVAAPFSYSNPYDPTAGLVPPEMFYGRGAELEAVRGINGRCFIYGGRQLGKTALLRRAEQSFHAPSAHRFSRWIDLRAEGIGVSRAPGDLWVCLTEQLRDVGVLDSSISVPNPAKRGSVEKVLGAIRDFLGANLDRRVLLLLDEADRFFEQDGREDYAQTRRLKQLMDDTQRRFKVVFAGLHNVLRMTERANHPLAHFGEPIKIGPLLDEHEVREAEDLVRKPLAAAGYALESRSLVVRILAQTNYYPSLIQLYCSHLLRHMLTKVSGPHKPAGPRYLITDRDIESVYSSGALREEIRAKFRLTLELDPRYEVVAYALALNLLRGRYDHAEGMDWQRIRQTGAMYWWPEGFRETTELDFRVLLDEMVELGVLSRVGDARYTLRNPNVLLLLGTLGEIETVLVKDREPAVEFQSALFRPPLRADPASARRSPLTFQQLSELLRRTNSVTAVAGTQAAGVAEMVPALRDYLGQAWDLVVLDDCADRGSFAHALDRMLKARNKDTVVVVPPLVPWSAAWVNEARQKLARLSSDNKFVAMMFIADPAALWGEIGDETTFAAMNVPWMSLLPWHDAFVRHWLQERHLPSDVEVRKQLAAATGYWPGLLYELVDGCTEARDLTGRLGAAIKSTSNSSRCEKCLDGFGLEIHDARSVLETLALLDEPIEASDLSILMEGETDTVRRALRWADLLGLARRDGGDFWSVDPAVRNVLSATRC